MELRRPEIEIKDLAQGPLGDGAMLSPRVANSVFGLGLLEAVPEGDLLARADPADADQDGISGRVNRVFDRDRGEQVVGRFGWKANEPTLRQQAAGALAGDIGITSAHFADGNFTAAQTDAAAYDAVANGRDEEGVEFSRKQLDALEFYLRTLAVPASRHADETSRRAGRALFHSASCNACHVPELTTRPDAALTVLQNQTFAPFTDLLLHDMGEGLADDRPDHVATGREWRTPPLWGLGLQERVSGHTELLHDGRARNLEEAILWHGGEAETSRDAFMKLPAADRRQLIDYVEAL